MKGIQLREVSDNNAAEEAVVQLEKMLVPSLTERGVNLSQYAAKLNTCGKVWCHYDMGRPVSAKKAEAEDVLKKLLASGVSADEILEKLK